VTLSERADLRRRSLASAGWRVSANTLAAVYVGVLLAIERRWLAELAAAARGRGVA
jgi:hypothetical protein